MNKVYVAQENPRVDIISATKWGELIPLSNFKDQLHLNTGRLVMQLKRKLKDFDDKQKYLVAQIKDLTDKSNQIQFQLHQVDIAKTSFVKELTLSIKENQS